eukprot:6400480-Pyramimonas_sp.AAC.1
MHLFRPAPEGWSRGRRVAAWRATDSSSCEYIVDWSGPYLMLKSVPTKASLRQKAGHGRDDDI